MKRNWDFYSSRGGRGAGGDNLENQTLKKCLLKVKFAACFKKIDKCNLWKRCNMALRYLHLVSCENTDTWSKQYICVKMDRQLRVRENTQLDHCCQQPSKSHALNTRNPVSMSCFEQCLIIRAQSSSTDQRKC